MSVYVDDPIWPYGRMMMCHMMADTRDELHAMADKIGVARKWFQGKPRKVPHYDICKSKRRAAIGFGAVEVKREQVAEIMRQWRSAMMFCNESAATEARRGGADGK